MRLGVDYYPEHWERKRWEIDAKMMKDAGIEVVRIGEFDWSLYEPEEEQYAFDWMDEIMDHFQQNGLRVVLCTPSATPPKWMTDKYPDIYQWDIHGNPKVFGTRKHYCFNSTYYRKKVRKLVGMIAKRYAAHPALEAWQIDNELGWANTTRCYCKSCEEKFKRYLADTYQTIDNLNQTYGTVFWSQVYNRFEETILPRAGACYEVCHDTQGQNPSLLLDYYRFCSDSVVSFTRESKEVIQSYSDKPITSNLLDATVNSGTGIDYFELSKELDFVSWDNYIEFQWGIAEAAAVSKDHALLRSYKKKPFWVMEQQSGPCGWSKLGPAPTPGKLRLWTYQAIANGADTVVYFRWRACPFGTEEYWHGILNHDGKPNRRYEEIKQIGKELKQLSERYGSIKPVARVAIVKSFDSEWSHSIHGHVEGFHYDTLLLSYYKAFYDLGIAVDFVSPLESLDCYKLVLAPSFVLVKEAEKENLTAYVKRGGNLFLTFRSGIKDTYNTMRQETVPGIFLELTGIEVEEYDPQYQKMTKTAGVYADGTAALWCDVIKPKTAKVLGRYLEDYYKDEACFTKNTYGSGSVYYLGCDLDEEAMKRLALYLKSQSMLSTEIESRKGVEVVEVEQEAEGGKTIVVMNHNAHQVMLAASKLYYDVLNDKFIEDAVELEPYGVCILERPRD